MDEFHVVVFVFVSSQVLLTMSLESSASEILLGGAGPVAFILPWIRVAGTDIHKGIFRKTVALPCRFRFDG